MNIRVDLNTPIFDGTEVVFRSPVDCSQVTGLIVYYPDNGNTISKEFAFADAHGNNVGDIDHLFAENVVVKVILDVTASMAFVQNADTNAYLEGRFDGVTPDDSKVSSKAWSSKNTIDKLCPAFTESGAVVTCEPVEGYPLDVEWLSKNLFNYKDWIAYANRAYQSTNHVAGEDEYLGKKCFSYRAYRSVNDMYFTDIRFKPNTQYTIKLKMAMQYGSNTEYALPALLFSYTDGISSYVPNRKTVYTDKFEEFTVTSDAGKTISHLVVPSFSATGIVHIPIDSCVIMEGTTAEYKPYEETATITRCGRNFFGGELLADTIVARGGKKYEDTGIITFNANNVGDRAIPFFTRFKENTQYTFVLYGRNTNDTFEINHFNIRIKHTDGTAVAFEGKTPGVNEQIIVTSHAGKSVEGIFFTMYGGNVELKYDLCGVFEGVITAEEFEAYNSKTFAQGEQIPALNGVNTLWADSGKITVSGKADPVARLEKLENAILAMGANV